MIPNRSCNVPNRLVIISDCTDTAYSEMRGVILRTVADEDPSIIIHIEPLVATSSFSVINAAFILRLLAESYPEQTMFMVIMNSLQQRTERIIGSTVKGKFIFEGTNTGAFGWFLRDLGISECFELHDPGFVPFGGKYVHAPAVGKILAGVPMHKLGSPFEKQKIKSILPDPYMLVHIDNFGNGKFVPENQYNPGTKLSVILGGQTLQVVYDCRMMDYPDGTWVMYPGSSMGLYEIGQVRSSGLLELPVQPGDHLIINAI